MEKKEEDNTQKPNSQTPSQEQTNKPFQTEDSNQKQRRHRRSKNDIEGRKYICQDCGKSYLSPPALTNHRKTKHGYGIDEGEKKKRGRPRKEQPNSNSLDVAENKFKNFFEKDYRNPNYNPNETNNNVINGNPENKEEKKLIVTKEYLSNLFEDLFRLSGEELFEKKIKNIKEYSFYSYLIDNWEKESTELEDECYSGVHMNKNISEIKPIKSIPLDGVFLMYLKEVSNKTNKDYFWFLFKFIIVFRECNNKLKVDLVKNEMKTDTQKFYSQIFNAEVVPDICNDFFMVYIKTNGSFGLNCSELIEAIQHFCYWIYKKEYTRSRLTLLQG